VGVFYYLWGMDVNNFMDNFVKRVDRSCPDADYIIWKDRYPPLNYFTEWRKILMPGGDVDFEFLHPGFYNKGERFVRIIIYNDPTFFLMECSEKLNPFVLYAGINPGYLCSWVLKKYKTQPTSHNLRKSNFSMLHEFF
jgi:hypothetical protein